MSEAVQETTVEQTSDNKSEASVEQVKNCLLYTSPSPRD